MATPFPFSAGSVLTATEMNATADVPRVLVYRATSQSLTGSTYNQINFDAEAYDSHGMHDTVTNNHRLTVPTGWGGYYHIFWGGVISTGVAQGSVFVNGSGTPQIYGDGGADRFSASAVLALSAGHYVDLRVYPTSSPLLYGNSAIGGYSPYFGAIWLAPS